MAYFADRRSPRAVALGRANKAAGSTHEFWIDLQHAAAWREGLLAHVEKNEPHSRVVSGRVLYSAAGVADYTGTLAAGTRSTSLFSARAPLSVLDGVTLAVEAKSTSAARLARAEVKPRQAEHLGAVARAGGLALLLVEFRGADPRGAARYAVPWAEVPWAKLRTADSVGAADLARWSVLPGATYLALFTVLRGGGSTCGAT